MNPHSLDFSSPILSPKATPSKRRILGEIQNFSSPTLSPKATPSKRRILGEIQNHNSPAMDRLKNSPNPFERLKSPPDMDRLKSPIDSPKSSPMKSPMIISPLASLASPLMNSPLIGTHSPLTTRIKRTSKISKIYEERTKFKMDKENFMSFKTENFTYSEESFKKESYKEESYLKFDLEETARDFSFGEKFQACRERKQTWSSTKLDFTDALPARSAPVPEPAQDLGDLEALQDLDDLEALQDLEEYDQDRFEQCTKYEIISTDSPDVISRGRSSTRKITSRNFEFGAALSDSEPSTSFPRAPATRVLNFDEDFEFTSPAARKTLSVKKSLKFETDSEPRPHEPSESPRGLAHQRSDSSVGSFSPPGKLTRVYTSESTASMESGFVSELDEPFLDLEESSSPKIANFNELLSGQIKENVLTGGLAKRPPLARSLSFHPDGRKGSLLAIVESPGDEKRKREDDASSSFGHDHKRRRSDCENPLERVTRPCLQRALSENNASIKSALARSSLSADLIGDYSGHYALPAARGAHGDLRTISADTLAALLRGEYSSTVPHYQVIDCRYPYEWEGGHIRHALNVHCVEQTAALLARARPPAPVLVLHCEFSLERGPKLLRALRAADRALHRAHYPALAFPELYLLHGGYRAFHAAHPELCSPSGYTRMLDPRHKHLLRRHRSLQERRRVLL